MYHSRKLLIMTKISSNNYQNTYSTTPKAKNHRVLKTVSKLAVASAVVVGTYYAGKKTGTFDILRKKVFNNEKLHALLNTVKTFLLGIGIGKTAFEIKDAIQEDSQNNSQKNIKEEVKAGVKEAIKETIEEADEPALPAEVVVELTKTEQKQLEQAKVLQLLLAQENTQEIEPQDDNEIAETTKDFGNFASDIPDEVLDEENKELPSITLSFDDINEDDEDFYGGIRAYDKVKNLDMLGFGHIDTQDYPISFEDLVFVGNRAMDENLNIVSGKIQDKRFENAYFVYDDGFLKKYVCQKGDEVLTTHFSYDKQNIISKIEVITEPAEEAMKNSEWSVHPNRKPVKIVTFDRTNQTMSVKKYTYAEEFIYDSSQEKTYDKNGKCIKLVEFREGFPKKTILYNEKKVITYEGVPSRRVVRDLEE